jgi:hypothetical protein
MGPTLVPENPKFATESEREGWELLCHKLRPEDVVLANLRLTNRAKDHEADLIVFMPGVGMGRCRGQGRQRLDPGWRLAPEPRERHGRDRSGRTGTRQQVCRTRVRRDGLALEHLVAIARSLGPFGGVAVLPTA